MSRVIEKTVSQVSHVAKRRGSLTMEIINQSPGNYPVYAASVGSPIGFIDDYNNDQACVVIPTAGNGTAGKPYVVKDPKYTIGANAVGFIPDEGIDVDYLFFQIKNELLKLVKGESFKSINQGMIKDIKVHIPIDENGGYDLDEQERLSSYYSEIEDKKKTLLLRVDELNEIMVNITSALNINYELIPLNDLVTHSNGNSKYTKSWCQRHKGENPIFSANNNDPIAFVDSYDFDGEFLTYSKNGCAGYTSLMSGRFSVNGDRSVLIVNEKYQDDIDLLYLKYVLEPIFRTNKKGRMGKFGKNEFTKLNSTMIKKLNIMVPLPLDAEGKINIELQREIADKYKQVDVIKEEIKDKILYLTSIHISTYEQ